MLFVRVDVHGVACADFVRHNSNTSSELLNIYLKRAHDETVYDRMARKNAEEMFHLKKSHC
ncbi:MAG: hypothetical protein ACI8RD_007522 [Bacillariaceae sp.]|jgi:hypothetical protein